MSQMGTDLGFESRVVGKTLVDVGSAAGEVLAASKTAIERTAKIDGLTWFVNIGLCLLDFALGAVGKRFYSRVRDATIGCLDLDLDPKIALEFFCNRRETVRSVGIHPDQKLAASLGTHMHRDEKKNQ